MAAQFQGYVPSSTVAPGGGDITKVGTPVDNQIGIWTGDGTIEGDSNLTWDGTKFVLAGVGGQIKVLDGTEALPAYSWSGDPTTGFRRVGGGQVHFSALGTGAWAFQAAVMGSVTTGGPQFRNEVASATNPTVIPDNADADTGLGQNALDQLSLIAGGSEIARCIEQGVGNDQFLLAPTLSGNATFPSLAFGDGDSGIYETVDDQLAITIAATDRWIIAVDQIGGILAGSAMILNETASNTNPTIVPFRTDPGSGLGGISGQPSLIANGKSGMSVSEAAGAVKIGFYGVSPIARQTGVSVTTSAVHAALVALGLITA